MLKGKGELKDLLETWFSAKVWAVFRFVNNFCLHSECHRSSMLTVMIQILCSFEESQFDVLRSATNAIAQAFANNTIWVSFLTVTVMSGCLKGDWRSLCSFLQEFNNFTFQCPASLLLFLCGDCRKKFSFTLRHDRQVGLTSSIVTDDKIGQKYCVIKVQAKWTSVSASLNDVYRKTLH